MVKLRVLQASAEGNHDNPVSVTTRHHHTENSSGEFCRYFYAISRGKGGMGAKITKMKARKGNLWAGLSLSFQVAEYLQFLVGGDLNSQSVLLVSFSFCFLQKYPRVMLIVAGGNPQLPTLSDSPIVCEMIDLSKSAVKYSLNAQRQGRTGLLMETTGQHCSVFNLA